MLYHLAESITIGASLLESFMPETSEKILRQLNVAKRPLAEMDEFGKYPSGNQVTGEPEILFADEPTGALNSQTGLDVLDTLTAFHEQGQSVVMVTHDMRSARRGNRILYLKDGAVLGECDLGKYVHGDRSRHEKLSAFLEEMGW